MTETTNTSTIDTSSDAYGKALIALYELSKTPGGVRNVASDPKKGAVLGAQYGNKIGGAYGAAIGALVGAAAGGIFQAINYFANKRPQFTTQDKQKALDYLAEYRRAAPMIQGRELTIEQLFQLYAALRVAYGSKGITADNKPGACAKWPPNSKTCEVTTTFNADAKALQLMRRAFDGDGLSLVKQAALLIDKARNSPLGAPISVQYENAAAFPNPGADAYQLARPLGEAFVTGWARTLGKTPAQLYNDPFWSPVELHELQRHVLDYVADTKGVPLSPTALRMYGLTPEQLAAQLPKAPGTATPLPAALAPVKPLPVATPAAPGPVTTKPGVPVTTTPQRYKAPAVSPVTVEAFMVELAKLQASIAADRAAGRTPLASELALQQQYEARRVRAMNPVPTPPTTVAALDAAIVRLSNSMLTDQQSGLPALPAEVNALATLRNARALLPTTVSSATPVTVKIPPPTSASASSSSSAGFWAGALALLALLR